MAVDKEKYGNVITYTGTLAEVAQAISDDQVPVHKIQIFYNGTDISAVWKVL
jgi:hypothetical protein